MNQSKEEWLKELWRKKTVTKEIKREFNGATVTTNLILDVDLRDNNQGELCEDSPVIDLRREAIWVTRSNCESLIDWEFEVSKGWSDQKSELDEKGSDLRESDFRGEIRPEHFGNDDPKCEWNKISWENT